MYKDKFFEEYLHMYTKEQIVNITALACNGLQLTSLKGIENLVNLKRLYCSDNYITEFREILLLKHLTHVSHNIKNYPKDINEIRGLELRKARKRLIKSL